MGNRVLRALTVFLGVSVAAWVASLVVSSKLTRGDESSDDFQVATIMNGAEFHSHAANLKSGTVITIMGGVRIDLRGATLDPSGASLELNTMMGGLEVDVPEDWAVEVDQETEQWGQVEVNVTSPQDLPEDAPRLRIHSVLRMGEGLITNKTT
jgi:hypothetical protein